MTVESSENLRTEAALSTILKIYERTSTNYLVGLLPFFIYAQTFEEEMILIPFYWA